MTTFPLGEEGDKLLDSTQANVEGCVSPIRPSISICSLVRSFFIAKKNNDDGTEGILSDEERKQVTCIMSGYASRRDAPSEWSQYVIQDENSYTRHLIDEGPDGSYSLILITWGPGISSDIHDHPGSNCLMTVLQGCVQENCYKLTRDECKSPVSLTSKKTVYKGETTYIHDTIGLHSVQNASSSEYTVTLHLYMPSFTECMLFFQESGSTPRVSKCFYSGKHGKKID